MRRARDEPGQSYQDQQSGVPGRKINHRKSLQTQPCRPLQLASFRRDSTKRLRRSETGADQPALASVLSSSISPPLERASEMVPLTTLTFTPSEIGRAHV